jgi:hypothetical protein
MADVRWVLSCLPALLLVAGATRTALAYEAVNVADGGTITGKQGLEATTSAHPSSGYRSSSSAGGSGEARSSIRK